MSSYSEGNNPEINGTSENIAEDAKSNEFSKLLHVLAAFAFSFGYIYDWLHVIYPPEIMKMSFCGKLQFITYWNVVSFFFLFEMCNLNSLK